MVSSILFAGSEDLSFSVIGQGTISSTGETTLGVGAVNQYQWQPYFGTGTAGYRVGYSRYGLGWYYSQPGNTADFTYLRTLQFSTGTSPTTSSNFWTTARLYASTASASTIQRFIRFVDSAGVVRLRVRTIATGYPSTIVIETVNAVGTTTTLATSVGALGTSTPTIPDKIDIYVNYAVAGTFTVYCNGVQIVTYSGDITTNGQTALAFVDFGIPASTNGFGSVYVIWSEIIVATRDTRNMSLITQVPAVNGNSAVWTTNGITTSSVMSIGNSSSSRAANEISYTKVVFNNSGNVSVVQYNLTANATGTSQAALYVDTTGNPTLVACFPTTLIATSGTVANASVGFTSYTFSPAITVAGNTTYWFAYRNTAAISWEYYSNGTSTNNWWTQAGQTSFPSSAAPVSSSTATLLHTNYTLVSPTVGIIMIDNNNVDATTTVNQVQEYQIEPALPTGNFSVVSVVNHTQATIGSSGPGNINAYIRTGSSEFDSNVKLSPSTAWSTLPYHWDTNPNTAASWQTTEIVAASNSFNMGYKSIT